MREAVVPPRLLRLSFLQALDEHLQHLPGYRRVRLDERPEVPRRHPVAVQLVVRGDGRGAVDVGDESDLAEVVAGPELPHVAAADADRGAAALDDEEPDAALAFLGDLVAGPERSLLHRGRDLLQLTVAEVGEERYALDQFGRRSRHCEEHRGSVRRYGREADRRWLLARVAESRRRAVRLPRQRIGQPAARLRPGRARTPARARSVA